MGATHADLTMSYEALVEAGREARKQADDMQWVEGDLALRVEALPATERPRHPETGEFLADEIKALKRYAEDVDIPYSTLQKYRKTAEAWPPSERSRAVGWAIHYVLITQEDRFDLIQPGMTYREAQQLVRGRAAGTAGKPGWFELLGKVGDTLITAGKHLEKAEQAIEDPHPDLRRKAEEYAQWAEDVAARLRNI